jgi:endonuclease YncB( thermonuclease family)
VVVLAGLVLASPAQAYPTMPQGVQGPYTVLKVVDGDTIHVSVDGKKLKIRMIGLDTPETVDPRKPVQCFGREASAQAKTLLGGQQVYLETDPSQDTIDKYGRTLATRRTSRPPRVTPAPRVAGCGRRTPVRNETWGQSGPGRKRTQ